MNNTAIRTGAGLVKKDPAIRLPNQSKNTAKIPLIIAKAAVVRAAVMLSKIALIAAPSRTSCRIKSFVSYGKAVNPIKSAGNRTINHTVAKTPMGKYNRNPKTETGMRFWKYTSIVFPNPAKGSKAAFAN